MITCRERVKWLMTEKEICRLALEFVYQQGLPVSEITAVRRIRFDHATEGPRDLWVVCFATKERTDLAEYAPEVIVEVRDDTGEVTLFGSAPPEGSSPS
jgi:hypothetical protein